MPDADDAANVGNSADVAGALASLAETGAAGVEAVPAATVVLLRDGPGGLEVLMLRRSSALAFAGGMWVFPGGRVDPEDFAAGPTDELSAARRAAVREAEEEAGLVVGEGGLLPWSHWTPPAEVPRRFATWFFVTRAPEGDVTVDGGEIHDHRWVAPREVLRQRDIELIPPTWITLAQLAAHDRVESVLDEARSRAPEVFQTRIAPEAGGAVALYEGDAGYRDGNTQRPGPRHRLHMTRSGWRYERPDGTVVTAGPETS